ncbi:hypothetical protein D3C81_1609460 [compost metagenome]
MNTEGFQFVQLRHKRIHRFHNHGLGNLQLQTLGCQARLLQDAQNPADEVLFEKLNDRDINGDFVHPESIVLQPFGEGAGLFQHPFTDRYDQAAVLGDLNER